jgi:N-acetylneuraminate synthase
MDPQELKMILEGSRAIWESRGDHKGPVKEEQPTIDFAFASVVTIASIKKGEKFIMKNIWVKRPGTGEMLAKEFNRVLGKEARKDISKNIQLRWNHVK